MTDQVRRGGLSINTPRNATVLEVLKVHRVIASNPNMVKVILLVSSAPHAQFPTLNISLPLAQNQG